MHTYSPVTTYSQMLQVLGRRTEDRSCAEGPLGNSRVGTRKEESQALSPSCSSSVTRVETHTPSEINTAVKAVDVSAWLRPRARPQALGRAWSPHSPRDTQLGSHGPWPLLRGQIQNSGPGIWSARGLS